MAKAVYRCSRCRTRNSFNHSVAWYKRPRKCRDCGHAHFYPDRERMARKSCDCLGAYFWGKHRWGAAYCENNPDWEYNRAIRDGASAEDMIARGAKPPVHVGDDVPF